MKKVNNLCRKPKAVKVLRQFLLTGLLQSLDWYSKLAADMQTIVARAVALIREVPRS